MQNYNRKVEETLAGGNCAFNAFILAITSPEVCWNISEGQEAEAFLDRIIALLDINALLNLQNFSEKCNVVRNKLMQLHQINSKELQEKFNEAFRLLAISLVSQDAQHCALTEQPLLAAFDEFLTEFSTHSSSSQLRKDDIFFRHPFIEEKFRELAGPSKSSLDPFSAISMWWRQEGHSSFLEAMKKQGEWAGDSELAVLAKFFDVNLNVYKSKTMFELFKIQDINSKHKIAKPSSIYLKHQDGHWENTISIGYASSKGQQKQMFNLEKYTQEIRNNRAHQFDANKWKKWSKLMARRWGKDRALGKIEKDLKAEDISHYNYDPAKLEQKVYYLLNGKQYQISRKAQIVLDKEYAKKVQAELLDSEHAESKKRQTDRSNERPKFKKHR